MLRRADIVVTLGRGVQVEPVEGTRFEQWIIDEPSERGLDGIDACDWCATTSLLA